MKSYHKGILVGILIIFSSLLLMGYTSSNSEVGRYQLESGEFDYQFSSGTISTSNNLYKIDTKTGETYKLSYNDGTRYLWLPIDKMKK